MIGLIKNWIKWITPYGLISNREQFLYLRSLHQQFQKKQEITNYFLSLSTPIEIEDPEILEIINYFKNNKFSIFPYDFTKNYYPDVDVLYDGKNKTQYVLHQNKRLYFPNEIRSEIIPFVYNNLCLEQDINSPHRYEAGKCVVEEGDIIADCGVAEGLWALSNVEKAGKIYLFECDKKWINALQQTFEPWKEKVIIVNKYVSNINNSKNITLDHFL